MSDDFNFKKTINEFKKASVNKKITTEEAFSTMLKSQRKNLDNAEAISKKALIGLKNIHNSIQEDALTMQKILKSNQKTITNKTLDQLNLLKYSIITTTKSINKKIIDGLIESIDIDLEDLGELSARDIPNFKTLSALDKERANIIVDLNKAKITYNKFPEYIERAEDVMKIANRIVDDNLIQTTDGKRNSNKLKTENIKTDLMEMIKEIDKIMKIFKLESEESSKSFSKIEKLGDSDYDPAAMKFYAKLLSTTLLSRKGLSSQIKTISFKIENLIDYIKSNEDAIGLFTSFKVDKLKKDISSKNEELKKINKSIKELEKKAVDNFTKIAKSQKNHKTSIGEAIF